MSKDFLFPSSIKWAVKKVSQKVDNFIYALQTSLHMQRVYETMMLCRERYSPPTGTYWPARAPGTRGYGSAQLQRTGQLDLDFLQRTSPRHWDDLARTSHIQRLQTKLNKVPVWVYKAQNTVEARGFCCIWVYVSYEPVRLRAAGEGRYI